MKSEKGFTLTDLVFFIVGWLIISGWAMNIIDLVGAPVFSQWTGVWFIKAIGVVVVPLGGVMGWI